MQQKLRVADLRRRFVDGPVLIHGDVAEVIGTREARSCWETIPRRVEPEIARNDRRRAQRLVSPCLPTRDGVDSCR